MIISKIVLLDTPECCVPDKMRDSDGTISIAIKVPISINIKERELTVFQSLISNFSNTFEQDVSEDDQLKLQNVHHKRHTRESSLYRGYLMADGLKVLDGYVVVSASKEKPIRQRVKYSFQIIGTHQIWKEPSKELLVCDIPAQKANIVWNEVTLLNAWMNNAPYSNGGDAFYPLLANFGKYLSEENSGLDGYEPKPPSKEVSLNDIRLLNYIVPLIRGGFCEMGYTVKSKFLESDFARRQAGYHMGVNYAKNSVIHQNHLFRAKTDHPDGTLFGDPSFNPTVLPIDDDFTSPCFDRGNTYSGPAGVPAHPYAFENNTAGMVQYRFHYDLRFVRTTPSSGIPPAFPVRVHLVALMGEISSLSSAPPIVDLPVDSQYGNAILMQGHFDLNVPAGYYVKLAFWTSDKDDYGLYRSAWFDEGSWYNERLSEVYLRDDVIDVNKSIDPGFTFNELIFDTALHFNWRFRTLESNKEVEFEPEPSNYNLYEVPLEDFKRFRGFLGLEEEGGYIDMTENVDLCEWIEKDLKINSKPSSYLFKFKNHSDKYELYDEYTDELPPLSKLVNTNGRANQVKIEMKKYEPTLNDFDEKLRLENSSAPYIPFMWGNAIKENGQHPDQSRKNGYRILCVLGWVEQYETDIANPARFFFEGIEYDYIPTVFQYYPHLYAPFDSGGSLMPRTTELNNVFGHAGVKNDLVSTLYGNTLVSNLDGIDVSFAMCTSNLKLHCWKEGMLMRLMFENGGQERFNGFYKFLEITKTVNNTNSSRVIARYIQSEESCLQDVIEEEVCDHFEIMRRAELWVDASDINGNNTSTPDGTPISKWVNKASRGSDLVQVGSQSVPVKVTVGNKEFVEFTSDQLQTQSIFPINGASSVQFVFIVSKTRMTSGDGFTMSVNSTPQPNATGFWGIQIPDQTGNLKVHYTNNTKSQPWLSSTSDCNIWMFKMARWSTTNPSENTFRKNGIDIGSNTAGFNLSSSTPLTIGRKSTGGQYQHISISEILIFRGYLNPEEVSCIEEHLSEKWSIPLD